MIRVPHRICKGVRRRPQGAELDAAELLSPGSAAVISLCVFICMCARKEQCARRSSMPTHSDPI
jgi:hypothetical protein